MANIVIRESDDWAELEINDKIVLTGHPLPLSLVMAEINAATGLEVECQYGTFDEMSGEFTPDV